MCHTMSLFHVPTAKPMRLDEFTQVQSQATSQVNSYFFLICKIILYVFVHTIADWNLGDNYDIMLISRHIPKFAFY